MTYTMLIIKIISIFLNRNLHVHFEINRNLVVYKELCKENNPITFSEHGRIYKMLN